VEASRIWLSVFCCELFVVVLGSPAEREAIRKGLIVVPDDDVETVRAMTLHGRRRWFLSHAPPDLVPIDPRTDSRPSRTASLTPSRTSPRTPPQRP
jgi:hypothetical protein